VQQKESGMRQRAIWQRHLFDDIEPFHIPQLKPEVREEATRLLVQWLQALAKAIGEEVDDEQDQR
jgi:hypothetical protein